MRIFHLFVLLGLSLPTFVKSSVVADGRMVDFQRKVQDALDAAKTLLDTTRHPVLPEDSDHSYDDKHALVDAMTNVAIAASITILERLGLSKTMLEEVLQKVHTEHKPIALHFEMRQGCTFVKEAERKIVVSEVEVETTASGILERLISGSSEVRVKNTVLEYHWNVTAPYKLVLRIGDSEEIPLAYRENVTTTMIVLGSLNQ